MLHKILYLPLFLTTQIDDTMKDTAAQVEKTVAQVEETAEQTVDWVKKITPTLIKYGKLILAALIIFLIGRKVIKILKKALKKTFVKIGMEEGLGRFLDSLIDVVLNLILIIMLAGFVGIETSSLVAVLSSAGLAVGLALQGSLSNFAGGVLILFSKPFVLGDYIVTPMGEGTVTDIGIAYTKLCTVDNRIIVIPNGTLSNSSLTNVTSQKERLLDMEIGVSYSADLKKVKLVIADLIKKQNKILKNKETNIFVKDFAGSAVTIGIRFWVPNENYWDVKWKFQEELKEAFDKEKIEIPYRQMDVHVMQGK